MTTKTTIKIRGKVLTFTPLGKVAQRENGGGRIREQSPGYGVVIISTPVLSAETIFSGGTLSGSATVSGKGIAQITYETMMKVGSYRIGPLQQDYLQAPENREIKGVFHPHWSAENALELRLTPVIRLLYCGEGFTLACMSAERYGVAPKSQIWSLEGIYQRGGGEPFRAKLEFDSMGSLIRKTGFYPTSTGGVVAPFELLIEDGDTFEPYVTLFSLRNGATPGTVSPVMLGGGNQLRWEEFNAPAGDYCLSVKVTDFDGGENRNVADFSITAP